MQKKLLAAAVLSAFAGAASAQSSSVTIYGTLIGDFQFANSTGADSAVGAGAPGTNNSFRTAASINAAPAVYSTRTRANPAGSNIGFRGTEDLGNGLSAWFQLEMSTTMGAPSGVPDGANHGNAPTWRNTAVGLRSNTWGTVSVGMWDTPFNVVFGATNANAKTAIATTAINAGMMGSTFIGQGAWSAQNEFAACVGSTGNANNSCLNAGMNFDRRQRALLQWWSPNWNGFTVRAAYAANQFADTQSASGNPTAAAQLPNTKPTIWDLSATYANGPLTVAYAYSRQKDLLAYAANVAANGIAPTAAGAGGITGGNGTGAWTMSAASAATAQYMSGSTGTGHRLGGKYVFNLGGGQGIGIGALWESTKWDMSYSQYGAGAAAAQQLLTNLKKTAYRLQANYTTGNHFVGFDYTRANELQGSINSATAAAANAFAGGGTGSKAYTISYAYDFSKRTSFMAYYLTVKNDVNATYGGSVFAAMPASAGADPTYYGVAVRHAF